MMNSQQLGQIGEAAIVNLLKKDNFTILEQNYKKFFGEIDIIAQRNDVIIFVEVKTRKTPKISMFEIVTPVKQNKIIKVAQEYIMRQNAYNKICRFDVALVAYDKHNNLTTTYIPNAFYQKEE